MKKGSFCCIVLFLIISLAHAQSPIKNKILNYSLKNGLSFGIVNSITQDDKGFMWFATNDGLNRFDGTTFKVFKSRLGDSTALVSNYVQKVLCDVHGSIWVSSRNGLSKFDSRTEKFIHYKFTSNKAVKNDISNIIQSHDGNLWITSYGQGFSYFNTKSAKVINYTQANLSRLSSNRVLCLYEDSKGLIWVGTQEGSINVFSHKDGVIANLAGIGPPIANLPSTRINDIFEDHFHNMWIATGSGLGYYNRQSNKFTLLQTSQQGIKSKRYISVIEDSDKQLLVGLQDGGLFKVNIGTNPGYNTNNF